ncbi:hypothetical protein JZ751_002163, partial [Albula glossodonta]
MTLVGSWVVFTIRPGGRNLFREVPANIRSLLPAGPCHRTHGVLSLDLWGPARGHLSWTLTLKSRQFGPLHMGAGVEGSGDVMEVVAQEEALMN